MRKRDTHDAANQRTPPDSEPPGEVEIAVDVEVVGGVAAAARAVPEPAGGRSAAPERAASLRATPAIERPTIVAVGASAGGLVALKGLLGAATPGCGLAFVILQHRAPGQGSHLAEILAGSCALPVSLIVDGTRAEPDHVYVPASDDYVMLEGGVLRLRAARAATGPRVPIDVFFGALAADAGDRAVGVILSGGGAFDGLRGLAAIHDAGGLCLAQAPHTAEFPALPAAAVDSGLLDRVVPVDEMISAILARPTTPPPARAPAQQGRPPRADWAPPPPEVDPILDLLRHELGADYRHYKIGMVVRRIERRRAIRGLATLADYLAVLTADRAELQRLSDDMLIAVSAFFRDPDAFEQLRTDVVVPLVARALAGGKVRLWVAGCATGEEVYSLVILFQEQIAAAQKDLTLQVFASDADEDALAVARLGLYPEAALGELSRARVERSFERREAGWQIRRALRDCVVFAHHNLIRDPPFPKLDLLSCRNVLIYLDPAIQHEVMKLFAFALHPGGYLFLGRAEGGGGLAPLFDVVSEGARIFRRTGGALPATHRARAVTPGKSAPLAPPPVQSVRTRSGAQLINQRVLLEHFGAAVLLTDAQGTIHHFFGPTERYLAHPAGLASLSVLQLVPAALAVKLRHVMAEVIERRRPGVVDYARPRTDGPADPALRITVHFAGPQPQEEDVLALVFEEPNGPPRPPAPVSLAPPAPSHEGDEGYCAQLETELDATRREYQALLADVEAAGEEHQSAAEEHLSIQEEFQVTKEELEASREELQSINEELNTTNSQLLERVAELTWLYDDLANFMRATQVATVFLDNGMRLRRFTDAAAALLDLRPSDLGRAAHSAFLGCLGVDVGDEVAEVLRSGVSIERDVASRQGAWFTMRVRPFRTQEDQIVGAVVTLLDVDRLKRAERRLVVAKERAESIIQTAHGSLVVLDTKLRILSANARFHLLCGDPGEQVLGRPFEEVLHLPAGRQQVVEVLARVLTDGVPHEHLVVSCQRSETETRTLLLNTAPLRLPEGEGALLLAIDDVTELMEQRRRLEEANARLSALAREERRTAERRGRQLRSLVSDMAMIEERERRRIAELLHDDLQQLLLAVRLGVERLKGELASPGKAIAADLLEAVEQAIVITRSFAAGLYPPVLYQRGLTAAIGWLAGQHGRTTGVAVQVDADEDFGDVGRAQQVILFKAVSELLLNVAKHAKAHQVRIEVRAATDGWLRLSVVDDGVGFDPGRCPPAASGGGLGLVSARERIEAIGGQMRVVSEPGGGTRVVVEMPRWSETEEEA